MLCINPKTENKSICHYIAREKVIQAKINKFHSVKDILVDIFSTKPFW